MTYIRENAIQVGQRYGRLVVLGLAAVQKDNRRKRWLCQCDCGGTTEVLASHLRSGHTKSCKCLMRDATIATFTKHGYAAGSKSSTYYCWQAIKSRCFNPNTIGWKNYGGRGITMCEYFRTAFENFLSDLGERPEGLSIDRIDNDGNYSCGHCSQCLANDWPANLRWATRVEQNANKRPDPKAVDLALRAEAVRRYVAGGVTQQQLADEYGVTQSGVAGWIKRDTDLEPFARQRSKLDDSWSNRVTTARKANGTASPIREEVVRRYLAGDVSQHALAREYGIGQPTVSKWVRSARA